jgi:hypothetical protein
MLAFATHVVLLEQSRNQVERCVANYAQPRRNTNDNRLVGVSLGYTATWPSSAFRIAGRIRRKGWKTHVR